MKKKENIVYVSDYIALLICLMCLGVMIKAGVKYFHNQKLVKNEVKQITDDNNNTLDYFGKIRKIEGQKVREVSEQYITLDNGVKIENLDGTWSECKEGDIIVDYDEKSESLVCKRGSGNDRSYFYHRYPTSSSSFWSNRTATPILNQIDEYKNSKTWLKNSGYTFDVDNNKYISPNGTTFKPDPNDSSKLIADTSSTNVKNKGTIKSLKNSANGGVSTGKSSGLS